MANNCSTILDKVRTRIDESGDLPVFSATVNRIRKIGNDPNSNAIKLADEVTKDANLTTKLLSLSNSSHYNHGNGKINVISRGIVLLGFNTIMNLALTLKLIESFQMNHPFIDMDKLLVNAYLSAGFARNIAIAAGVSDPEETYTCALLHNLGEIITAYALSEPYLALQDDSKFNPDTDIATLQSKHIGSSFEQLGQCLADDWGFPNSIIDTMQTISPQNIEKNPDSNSLNASFCTLSSAITEYLLTGKTNYGDMNFKQLISTTANIAGTDYKLIEEALANSFKSSIDHAAECGLKASKLGPSLAETDDPVRDHCAHKISQITDNISSKSILLSKENPKKIADVTTDNIDTNSKKQLDAIHEITTLISSKNSLQVIFTKVLASVCKTCNFERSALILINKDQSHYQSRMEYGNRSDLLKQYFDFPISISNDLFSKLLMQGSELHVKNINEPGWRNYIKEDFYKRTATDNFVIASLRNNEKPIGFFYADTFMSDEKITDHQYRCFIQFVTQARLAIQLNN